MPSYQVQVNLASPPVGNVLIPAASSIITVGPATGLLPTGAAGGDLTGSYPNPTFAVDRIPKSIVTTKGDLIAATGSGAPVRLAVGVDKQVLLADSSASAGVSWATPPRFFTLTSGRYYGPFPRVLTTGAQSAGSAFVTPVWVPESGTFDTIACQVSASAASSSAHLGVYASTGTNNQPGSLLQDAGSVDCSTNGFKSLSLTSFTIGPGWYWLAIIVLGGAPTFYADLASHEMVWSSASGLSVSNGCYTATGLSSLPSTWSSTTVTVGQPYLSIRKS